ncbi:MAG TPA: UDP-N-acetylmuramate--L-alanine ligase [Acidimicrobiales bacterium]|nr:UDP-N-acetylmuramate--L-alanine ligase [Acidimicrobiales bacterium]
MADQRGIPDLARPVRIHVVGAAGAGMSAIATVLAAMGHRVTGSDAAGGAAVQRLKDIGVDVHVGHDPALVEGAEIVAVSTAVPDGDPEVQAARAKGVRVVRRSEILAAICRQKRTIGVSGTHGKTTTSSMLAVLLRHAGFRPSMVIGGDVAGVGPGAVWEPDGEWMVVEADESDGTFLELGCEAVVVTSVSADHLDHYGTRQEIDAAFRRYVSEAPGPAVICADDPGASALVPHVTPKERVRTYGQSRDARVRVSNVSLQRFGSEFDLHDDGRPRGRFVVAAPGLHNVLNASGAIAAAVSIGSGWEAARDGIAAFEGVGRRFELRGESRGVTFVDDYAHNPEKVTAALAAARAGRWQRVVAVFQPHRFTRTQALWREFGPALAGADILVVTDVYGAGEDAIPGVNGELVARAVRDTSPSSDIRYVPTLEGAARLLAELLRPGDLCLTMGAGDVTKLPGLVMGLREGDPDA